MLRNKLKKLRADLNPYLAYEYGIDHHNMPQEDNYKKSYEKWLKTHQPFHWWIEFYEIMDNGGFDVIIGNPPYIEYSKVRQEYMLYGYQTESCGNLYAFVMERSILLLKKIGRQGFIVPISLVCTQRMSILQNKIIHSVAMSWHSIYAERPSKLFSGAEVLLTISLTAKGTVNNGKHWITGLRKWSASERTILFNNTTYQCMSKPLRSYTLPKLSSNLEHSIIEKMFTSKGILGRSLQAKTLIKLFYRIGGGRYWKIFTTFQPRFVVNGQEGVSSRESYLYFNTEIERDIAVSVLSSTLFYWYFIITTNGRDLNPSDLREFPLSISNLREDHHKLLTNLASKLMQDYKFHKTEKDKVSKLTGKITYEEFYPRHSKSIIDEIDYVLGQHYGFTDEEIDFIVNYDIKYRMGRDANDEREE
ncbi:hypothetical protein KDW_61200 [Dictyobacter vulcani]|uniref:site-specific DNA-methyltransferase (adenine-specific) n=1 Tax=Dictyobacter vulcani TaxID=2607529 RepID=A0A5J4KQI5_9CHLR|nr:Eco57I restriction-modification methylase domain-containing protein [Dictyobacter vulcani]GER91958.1 hypothetical protein KDW_61200 [Dictyobacter vulcani]